MEREPADIGPGFEAILECTPLPVPDDEDARSGLQVLASVAEAFRHSERPDRDGDARESRWGAFVLRRTLGTGAFGEVHLAWDPALQRDVALKLRRPEAGVLRWLDEARALARIRHPNVVIVHGADLLEGRAGIWMEYVNGPTLESVLRARGALPVREALEIALPTSSALAAVHAAGLVHGDVKAANLMLEEPGEPGGGPRVVLMDFGSVRAERDADDFAAATLSGTPLVTAPEVLRGAAPDARADLYAFGVLLARLLTGAYPVTAGSMSELLAAHEGSERDPAGALPPRGPRELVRLLRSLLARDPARRPASAREVVRTLHDLTHRGSVLKRRVRRSVFVGLAAMLAVLAWQGAQRARREGSFSEPFPPARDTAFAIATWRAWGANTHSELGWHVRAADLDGDGIPEVAGTEYGFFDDSRTAGGRIAVRRGSGPSGTREPGWSLRGDMDGFAVQLASPGDVDGDGRPDLVVSTGRSRSGSGAVQVFHGTASGPDLTPTWTVRAESTHVGGFGDGLGVGDLDGDGFADIVVGVTHADGAVSDAGEVRVYRGGRDGPATSPSWCLRGARAGGAFGWRVEVIGDCDGDGRPELVVSAPDDGTAEHAAAGWIGLFPCDRRGPRAVPSWQLAGTQTGAQLGMSFAAGDVDGDGFDDLLVAEPFASHGSLRQCGRVRLFRGGPRGLCSRATWEVFGRSTRALLGYHAVLLADLDADGFADAVLSAPGYSPGAGRSGAGSLEVHRGGTRGLERSPTWWTLGQPGEDGFAASLAFARDRRGTGWLFVGTPHATPDATREGAGDIVAWRLEAARPSRRR